MSSTTPRNSSVLNKAETRLATEKPFPHPGWQLTLFVTRPVLGNGGDMNKQLKNLSFERRMNRHFGLLSDLLGTTVWMAIVWFAFVVLFAPSAQAGDLQHEPAVRELAAASEVAATELVELRKDLRLQLQKRLDADIELDLEAIPESPLVSAARNPVAETGEL
jgi:hypothetical protein